MPRAEESTGAEDCFIDVFQEALGIDAVAALAQQYPTQDIYGGARYIDFALIGRGNKYAFEVDGEFWHRADSPIVTTEKFRDDLLRQNSLVHAGWRVYRWSDGQLVEERERVKDELRLFVQNEVATGGFDGYLPRQEAAEFSLYDHQQDALEYLAALRSEGKSIALLVHATGTGKTATAIEDARRIGMRTLYLAHTEPIVRQTAARIRDHWPEVECAEYRRAAGKPDAFVVAATIQGVHRNLTQFTPDEFGYVIVDEAHHAPARTFKETIAYFRPRFTLGLTATPDRMDGRPLLDIFAKCAPPLGLETAIQRGLLVPIRCVRVRTNVDLTRVRFNGNDYRASDLEERLLVPARDRLIVQTYLDHVEGRPGVTFCVNVRHAEEVARLYQAQGVSAQAVSGRMDRVERQTVLDLYESGALAMLCACDLLNEGWDSPRTEVLLMARPTLSRVLYVQQLGRGTRRHPGKDCLFVLDFIDNAGRYAQSLSVHRLFNRPRYRPGALVAAPQSVLTEEEEQLAGGVVPPALLHLGLCVTRIEDVDIFNWQSVVKDMLSVSELEVALGVGQGTALNWVRQGRVQPDHAVEAGSRVYYYFTKERIEAIRKQFGLRKRTAETRRTDFLDFVAEMDMSASYKPVFFLAFLDSMDDGGHASVSDVADRFRAFYVGRLNAGLVAESPRRAMTRAADMTDDEVLRILLTMPFEKFARRRFLDHARDTAFIRFERALWRSLTEADLASARGLAEDAVAAYYRRLEDEDA